MGDVAFRIDASAAVGAGHVARCRALAAQLRKRGRTCRFVAGQGARPWQAALHGDGFQVDLLPAAVDTGGAEDAEATSRALGVPGRGAWLVVDHYGLDGNWHSVLRRAGWRLLVIDDLANRPLDADAVLDPAPTASADAYRLLAEPGCELLLGSRYCLLREEFAEWRQESRRRPVAPGRVHLALGGTGPGDTLATMARLVLERAPDASLHAVAAHPVAALDALQARFRERLRVSVAPASVAETMVGCAAALGAPGGMLWERFCLGLPTACVGVSPNQVPVLAKLADAGWLLDLGSAGAFDAAAADRFAGWLADDTARATERMRLFEAVDGRGAERVADWLVARDA
jgi:UDP-2,4-diacetamido-2,4,6-trideoxy-beta-L-altropyranose hydrolase